jgi:NADH pyrophosphatase NudC (nudix superfamily)
MPSSSERSAANFLAGSYLDRRAELREDPGWLESARADAETLFLPAQGTALGVTGDPPTAAFIDHSHDLVRSSPDDSLVLLGWFRDRRCVLVQLDEHPATDRSRGDAFRFEELRPLAGTLGAEEAGLLAYARALAFWQRRHRHCGVCGSPTRPTRAGHVMTCRDPACATEFFPRIDPAIIVLVSDGERALLGRQASWPEGRYSTIAGFVEPGESLEDGNQCSGRRKRLPLVSTLAFPLVADAGVHGHRRTRRDRPSRQRARRCSLGHSRGNRLGGCRPPTTDLDLASLDRQLVRRRINRAAAHHAVP